MKDKAENFMIARSAELDITCREDKNSKGVLGFISKLRRIAFGTQVQKLFDVSTNGSLLTYILISLFISTTITGYPWVGLVTTVALLIMALKMPNKVIGVLVRIGCIFLTFICTFLLAEAITATVGAACAFCVWKSYRKKKRSIEWASGMILPILVVWFAEFLQSNLPRALQYIYYGALDPGYRPGYFMQHMMFLVGIFIVTFVAYFFFYIFNNKKIAYYITGAIFGLLSMVNFFVIGFTSQPFTFSDLKIATTAAGVIKSQALPLNKWIQLGIGVALIIAYFIYVTLVYKKSKEKKRIQTRVPVIATLCFAAIMLVYVGSGLYSSLLLFDSHNKYGYITNLFMSIDSGIKMPADVTDYILPNEKEDVEYKPNVIIIMDEAFSDFESEFGVECTEEVLPYFRSLQDKYPSGIAYTSVRGNNTCSSEWEVLSGVSTALTAKGAMVYQDNCKPMNSLVSLFNNRGYNTYGLHPYFSFGYNRANFWKALGFDKTVFIENMDEDVDTFRGFVTDEENFKQIISLYEQNEALDGEPFFCMNVTMQNHGGYNANQRDEVSTVNVGPYDEVNTYLSSVRRTDEALKLLIEYFEKVDEDTLILFFGDHQPLIADAFYKEIFGVPYGELTLSQISKVYSVPYLIWANYELEDIDEENISINYLSSYLFEVGGIQKSKWLEMVTEFREAYPVVTTNFSMTKDGELISTSLILQEMGAAAKEDPLYQLYLYQKYCYGVLYGTDS